MDDLLVILVASLVVPCYSREDLFPETDNHYLDPNKYFVSPSQNQHVQEAIKKYTDEDPRYYKTDEQTDKDLLNKFITSQDPKYFDPTRYENKDGAYQSTVAPRREFKVDGGYIPPRKDSRGRIIDDDRDHPYQETPRRDGQGRIIDDDRDYKYLDARRRDSQGRILDDEKDYRFQGTPRRDSQGRFIDDERDYRYQGTPRRDSQGRIIDDEKDFEYRGTPRRDSQGRIIDEFNGIKPLPSPVPRDSEGRVLKDDDPYRSRKYELGADGGPRQYFENSPGYSLSNDEIYKMLAQIDATASQQCTLNVRAQWDFETNVNDVTQIRALEQQLVYSEFQRKVRNIANRINTDDIRDGDLYRQIKHLSVVGSAALPPDQLNRYNRLINDMLAIYNTATICAHQEPLKCNLRLDPDLNALMARSRDWDELEHSWIEWHRRTGQKIRDFYEQLIDISNYAARLNNLTDTAEYWMFPFESASFKLEMEDAWNHIRPLYEQLHAYVRRKLRDLYGPEKVNREAPLPAHILGNMWGQSWENILDVTIPYPGKNFLEVTPQMIKQGYTPEAMFRVAEDFFVSLNMSAMPPDFWAKSVFEEYPGKPIVCQPSAWDFCNGVDYRIKMCTRVNMKDFVTVHHEMAHVQYFLNYRGLPKVYRDGANPGFHEAISEAVSLSVANPRHMQTLGLVLTSVDDLPHNVNFLFALAMDKLTFLPFSLAMDMWRWDIYKGLVRKDRYNCHWWDLRERLSGVKPPVLRSENDFDPGSKYHVPANIPYIGYYFGTILQFQLYRSMCKAAGQYVEGDPRKPLHKCDIYRSKEAGTILKRLMEAGSSMRWQEVLRSATGESTLDASALRDYFRPLEDWLKNENLRTGEFVGWVYDGDYCKYSIETANLQVYGGFYNEASAIATVLPLYAILLLASLAIVLSRR